MLYTMGQTPSSARDPLSCSSGYCRHSLEQSIFTQAECAAVGILCSLRALDRGAFAQLPDLGYGQPSMRQ